MATGDIPVYVLVSHEPQDVREILDVIAEEAGPIMKEASNPSIRSVPEAIHHASNLDPDQWDRHYIIIVDRQRWKSIDGVLVVNMDFEGGLDGLRMPASEAAIDTSSMSIANTDWEENIANSLSRYPWVPDRHFAVYVDRHIPDADNVLKFARTLMDAGFRGRKRNLGSVCSPVEDIRPSDVEEASRYHKSVAENLGCNGVLGCFIEIENWSFGEEKARLFRVHGDERPGSFTVDVEMAGESLSSIVVGLSSWEHEKARWRDP